MIGSILKWNIRLRELLRALGWPIIANATELLFRVSDESSCDGEESRDLVLSGHLRLFLELTCSSSGRTLSTKICRLVLVSGLSTAIFISKAIPIPPTE